MAFLRMKVILEMERCAKNFKHQRTTLRVGVNTPTGTVSPSGSSYPGFMVLAPRISSRPQVGLDFSLRWLPVVHSAIEDGANETGLVLLSVTPASRVFSPLGSSMAELCLCLVVLPGLSVLRSTKSCRHRSGNIERWPPWH